MTDTAPAPGGSSGPPPAAEVRAPGRMNVRKHLLAALAALAWTLAVWVAYRYVPSLNRYFSVRTNYKTAPAEVVTFQPRPGAAPGPKEQRLFLHYSVGDSRYTSLRFRTLDRELSQEEVARDYPLGTKLTIRYDPDDPDRSFVDIRLSGSSAAGLAAILVLFPLAVLLTRAAVKAPHRKPA